MKVFKKNKESNKITQAFTAPSSSSSSSKKKKRKSPLKKIKGFFRKKKVPQQTSLTLVSPEVSNAAASKYYSNNTDGFEVILEGRNLQYEENPNKEPPRKDSGFCGVGNACAPMSTLSEWDSFVNALSGNFNHLIFGDDESIVSLAAPLSTVNANVNGNVNAQHENRAVPPMQEIVTMTKSSHESRPFDEQSGEEERSAIETTLEQNQDDLDDDEYLGPSDIGETIEIHPFGKKNDGPIGSLLRNNMEHDDNDLLERPVKSAPQDQAFEFPPFEQPKEDAPEEEFYDTAFTLKFLQVCLMFMQKCIASVLYTQCVAPFNLFPGGIQHRNYSNIL